MPDFNENGYYVHPVSLVESVNIGVGTTIWAFVHVLSGATIGENCNICDHCFVEGAVAIGNSVTLKCGVYLWSGITLEDDVFVGPNVVFTNDVRPRSKNKDYALNPIVIAKGASLGANSTILAGVTVGRYALIGIGSVVTRNVLNHALVYGNPARQHGWVDESGQKLQANEHGRWVSVDEKHHYKEGPQGLELM